MDLSQIQEAATKRALTADEVRGLIQVREQIRTGGESHCVELKQELPKTGHAKTEAWVKLLLAAVSMSNGGGGYVLFGVTDDGSLTGVSRATVELLDPAKIQDQLRKYSPNGRITTQLTLAQYYKKTYAALWVSPGLRIVIFDRAGDYTDPKGEQRQAFKAGVVYTRNPGGRGPALQSELDEMVRRLVDRQVSKLVARIEQVAHIPPGADLLASHPGNPNTAYRLVSAGEGQPVRITQEEDESAVLLREVFDTDVPYQATRHEVAAQVRFWKSNPDHRAPREVTFGWLLQREEVEWTQEAAKFCLLSACHDWGYPTFWARKLYEADPQELKTWLEELIEAPSHPEAQYVPYLIASFFWGERKQLLARVANCGYKPAERTASRLLKMSNKEHFLRYARGPASSIRLGDEEHSKASLLEDSERALKMFERVVSIRLQVEHGEVSGDDFPDISSVGHQLDVLCFAK